MGIDIKSEPGRTLKRLSDALTKRQDRLTELTSWLDGDAPLPDCPDAYKAAYRRLQERARMNLAPVVVQAVKERMTPVGFLVGDSAAADKDAWRMWSVNEGKRQSSEVHSDMLGLVWGYVIVGEPDDTGVPVWTREDPRQCITEHDPLRKSRVTAALKKYSDVTTGKDYACLYLPGAVVVASRKSGTTGDISGYDWDMAFGDGGVYQLSVSDVVPVVCFENTGVVSGRPMAEFEAFIETIKRLQERQLDILIIQKCQAFRQRAVMGPLPETKTAPDPENPDQVIDVPMAEEDYREMFLSAPGRTWTTNAPAEGPEAIKFWESAVTDITPLLSAQKDDLRLFAAQTATPMSMLMPDSQNQSAEGASSAKEALVTKTKDRQALAGYGWHKVIQLCFAFAGKGLVNVETQWAPAELRSLAEMADAYSKMSDLPLATKLRLIMQLPPDEVSRIETELMSDILNGALGEPEATTATAGGSSGV